MNSTTDSGVGAKEPNLKGREKKGSPARVVVLLILLGGTAVFVLSRTMGFSLSGNPSEGTGKRVLEALVANQSGGAIRLTDFTKSNGREGELLGQKFYEMDYSAEIEFTQSGSWLKGDGFGGLRFEFTGQRYGGGAMAQLSASMDGAVPVTVGKRQKISGKLSFEKTEKGWKGEDGAIH